MYKNIPYFIFILVFDVEQWHNTQIVTLYLQLNFISPNTETPVVEYLALFTFQKGEFCSEKAGWNI